MGSFMKIARSRRNLFKAAGIAFAAVAGSTIYRRPAWAQSDVKEAPAAGLEMPKDTTETKETAPTKDTTETKETTPTKETTETTTSPSPSPTPKDPPYREPTGNVCFLRGSRILTADGYRPIESLAVGETVVAHFGGLSRIEAIRSFTLGRTGPSNGWEGASRPVRVKAGALGENRPARDLCLTASHAVFADGVLVPVGNLVNGTSIVLETADGHDTLEFFHIALARHDVIDAEGAACESWRDASAEAPCVPMLSFHGSRDALRSRLRSAASVVVDLRQPLDIIRDGLEERGLELARAA
jgi:hypothetical protein